MAFINDYVFSNMSRIGNDNCGLSQRNVQNTNSANYLLTNFSNSQPMNRAINFALEQPNINFKGGHHIDANGNGIDVHSHLTLGQEQTNPRCRISLYSRPFLTVPYLGRGRGNPVLESELRHGDSITNKKSITNLSEKSYLGLSHTPMIPSLKNSITNPVNLVESVAAEGWVRGGVPSRELTKGKEYTNN